MLHKTIVLFICLSLISACGPYSKKLWNKSPQYVEKIDSFMVSENGKLLAVLGIKYHYVFELNSDFKEILLSEYRSKLKPRFYSFQVNEENTVSGNVGLVFYTDDEKMINRLEKDGFKRNGFQRGVSRFISTGKLNGNRFASDKRLNKEYQLTKEYSVIVKESPTLSDNLEKIVKTPVTILVDGVVVIFGTFVLVTIGTICAMKNGCR